MKEISEDDFKKAMGKIETSKTMKDSKAQVGQLVQRVQFHTGIQLHNKVYNSLDADVNNCTIRYTHDGIDIELGDSKFHVFGSDILWLRYK
jgi:ribonuclease HIII